MAAAGAETSANGSGSGSGSDSGSDTCSGTGATNVASTDSDARPLTQLLPTPVPDDVVPRKDNSNRGKEPPHNAECVEEDNMEASQEAADSDDESSQVSDLSMGLIEDFEGKDSDDDERKRDDVLRQSLRLEIRSGTVECIVNYLL